MQIGAANWKPVSRVSVALAAAANCSLGQTPLHAAVENDCKYSVKVHNLSQARSLGFSGYSLLMPYALHSSHLNKI